MMKNSAMTLRIEGTISLRLLLLLLFSFYSAHVFSGQDQPGQVKALNDYKGQYQASREAILTMLKSRSDLDDVEKKAMYAQEIAGVKQQFRQQRVKDYENASVTIDVKHECRGISFSRAQLEIPIDCGFKCVTQPRQEMLTKKEWVTFTGVYNDTLVTEKKACVALISSDNFLTKVSVLATFKYNESYINLKVFEEAEQLFAN